MESLWLRSALAQATANVGVVHATVDLPGGNFWSSSHEVSTGTGISIGSAGKVLTAGHLLAAQGSGDVHYTFSTGVRKFELQPLGWSFAPLVHSTADLGLLAVNGKDIPPGLVLGMPVSGELLLITGFPEGYALSPGDVLVNAESTNEALRPIPMIARVVSRSPLLLELVAGSLPRQGMSGAPLINSEGECVGVLSGTSVTQTGNYETRFLVSASAIDERLLQSLVTGP